MQHALCVKNPSHARWVCILSAFLCLILVCPAVFIGLIARCTGTLTK